MKRAGCDREVFTTDALALLHEDAKGRLRDIDRIATDALKLAAKRKLKNIDRDLVGRILADAEQLNDE